MKIKPLIGPHGKMPILIRDNDTNFYQTRYASIGLQLPLAVLFHY